MKSKRIILNIAILLLTIVFASSISVFVSAQTADTNTPSIFIGDSTVVAGKTIEVDILLLNSPGVASVIIDVTFDEELLTLKSINFGEEFESGSDLPQTFASPIRLSWADLDNMVGDLSFATLTFEAKKNISKDCLTEICVEYASSNIINLEEEPVFFDVHNGKLTVNIGYPGDINGDGEVNAKDLLRLRKYFAGWDVQVDETAVDVNGDGEVNAKDLLRLRKYFAGWEVEIFYGTKSNLKCAHLMEKTSATPATCTETGNSEYWYCNVCDKYFSDAEGETEITLASTVIPAKGHTPSEAVIENRVDPTCTEKGSYDEVVYCTVCGDEVSRTHKEIAALGHTMTATVAKDATCTEAGNTAYWHCSVCDKYFSDAEGETEITLASTVIPATGHSFSKAWTYDDEYHWHVSTCGHDVVSDKTEHTFENGFCTVCKLGQKIVENGIKYQYGKENKETVLTVIAYEGNASEVVVPATVNGVRVSVINAHVFEGEQFTKITIPASLDYLGWNAIYGCPNLTEIAVSGEGCYFVVDNMLLYKGPRVDDDGVRLVYVPDGTTGDVIVPDVVTDIGADSFDNCVGVTSVHIPSSVKISCEFGVYGSNDSAFSNCPNLTTIYGYAGTCAETVASNNNIDFVAYSEGLAYTSNGDGTCAVTGIGDCTDTDIVIPPISLDGNTVTGIGDYAFQNCNGITSVTMPSSVTSMGNYALQSCRNLTSVKISSSVTNIGWYALSFCNKLTAINVDENNTNYSSVNGVLYNKAQTMLICYPEGKTETSFTILASVTSIKDGAFSGCSYLTAITADENNEYYSSVNGVLYNKNQTMIVCVPSGVSSDFVIPSNVSVIGNNAFAWCTKITNVTIPEGVTTISSNAFSGCSSLKSITIPDGVTSIGSYAFNQCSKLSRIILPASLKNISIGAFQKCSQLDSVYYLGTDEQWAEITIGSNNDPLINAGYARTYTYNGFIYANITISDTPSCIILGYVGDESEVVVPETINEVWVNRIVEGTFKGEQFTKITIPAGLDYLGWNAIYGCPNLTEIAVSGEGCYFVVDNMLLYKGPRVGDDGVRLVYVPDGTTGDVIVPDVVTDIGADSFDNCVGVTSVYIPSSVTSSSEFGGSGSYDSAFTNCTNLTTIYGYAGSCAETIASNNNIEFVNLFVTPYFYCNETDDGNLTIKKYYGKVSNVVIPETINGKTVVGIEKNSFYWVNLQSLYIPKTIKYIDEMAFRGLNLLSSVSVSDESTSFVVINGLLYTKDKTALVLTTCAVSGDVVVPEGVNTLYGSCFQSRTGITSITLPSTLKEINTFSFRDMRITSIVIPNGVEEIDEYAFFQSINLSEVIIPESVTTISDGAFEECTSLTSIVIPDSITAISATAFKNSGLTTIYGYAGSCAETIASNNGFEFVSYSEGLKFTSNGNGTCYVSGIGTCTDTEIIIPPTSPAGDAVTSIGRNAFFYHGSLTNIFIPSSVTSIDHSAFYYCSRLANVLFADNSQLTSIGYGAFSGCSGLTSVTFGDNSQLTSIGESAFSDCTSLTSIEIPSSVTSIGNNAFYDCRGLRDITLPDSVRRIGKQAFCGCTGLTSIKIPSSVTSIGDGAFWGCSSLTSIEIPLSVTSIGSLAFYGCTGLTSIEIPSSVTSIGNRAFSDCTNLEKIAVDEKNASYSSIDGVLYNKDKTKLLCYPACMQGISFEVPESVTNIGEDAFYGCTSLASITIPDGLTSISSGAFIGCRSLASIIIPNGVTNIGDSAFNGCTSLASITIPDGLTSIGDRAFNRCTSLESVTFPSSITSIGSYAFSDCTALTTIESPLSQTTGDSAQTGTIGDHAFYGCTSLNSITIPSSIANISNYTFNKCVQLIRIVMPASVTNIGKDAISYSARHIEVFYTGTEEQWAAISIDSSNTRLINAKVYYNYDGASPYSEGLVYKIHPNIQSCYVVSGMGTCTDTDIVIPPIYNGTSVIGIGSAFNGYTNITSVTFIEGCQITSIGSYAFYGCSSLTSIEIPSSVTSIGDSAFSGCSSLTSVKFGENSQLTSIGYYAFQECSSLTSIELPDGVTSISSSAFYGCSGLTSVTFGENSQLLSIGGSAFSRCYRLASIEIPSSVTSIVNEAFYGCSSLTSVTFGENSQLLSIGDSAFNDCPGLTSITIPSSVKNIGSRAFSGCSDLTTVYYTGTSEQWAAISIGSYNSNLTNATIIYNKQ